MPVTPSYPGVYIEEIPSGVRTITGVATSVTGFIGRALRGPVDQPPILNAHSVACGADLRLGSLCAIFTRTAAVRRLL